MKYAVDQIIDNIALLENIDTKEKKEIPTKKLPKGAKEGSIIIEDRKYILDLDEENRRREFIKNKLDRLKRLK